MHGCIKNSKKSERGHSQGLPNFVGTPILSQKRVKLRTSNFVHIFTWLIGTKPHDKFCEK